MQERDGADPQALALTLVDFSQPLQSATVTESRNACVTVSDNALFQRLCKRFKGFSRTSDTDVLLLGGSEVEDNIVVEELHGDARAFVAHFELPRFRLRMRVAKQVCVEFVARGKLHLPCPDSGHTFLTGICQTGCGTSLSPQTTGMRRVSTGHGKSLWGSVSTAPRHGSMRSSLSQIIRLDGGSRTFVSHSKLKGESWDTRNRRVLVLF
jgi:hypothetical protein